MGGRQYDSGVMAGNLAPDWYPDPGDPSIMRWWDGARWSGETRSAAGAAGGSADLPSGGPAVGGEAGPAPFGGIVIPDAAVTPGATVTGESGTGDQHASWREPALQAWDAAYRAAGPAAVQDAFPVRAWLIGGVVAVVIAAVATWFLVGLLG